MAGEKTNTLRDRLRHETASAHQSVDGMFGSAGFDDETGYGRFLTAQAVAWESLRPSLDPASLARADALREDLAALGLPIPAPLPGSVPAELSIGHRYVLEGSRLGSTVLLRELTKRSPELAGRAGAYLTESGKIDEWKRLSTRLQMDEAGCGNASVIIDDALFVFGLFEKAWRATNGAHAKVS